MRMGPLCGEIRLDLLRPLVSKLQNELFEPLDFGCQTILVDTFDGYSPDIDVIVSRVDGVYGRPVIHDLDQPDPQEPECLEET